MKALDSELGAEFRHSAQGSGRQKLERTPKVPVNSRQHLGRSIWYAFQKNGESVVCISVGLAAISAVHCKSPCAEGIAKPSLRTPHRPISPKTPESSFAHGDSETLNPKP